MNGRYLAGSGGPKASVFGGRVAHVTTMSVQEINEMYRKKCGVDVTDCFLGASEVSLFECQLTGMRFWWPSRIAGDESFYKGLSAAWPNYYRSERWEYALARSFVRAPMRVLEVGCGRGYFLRSLEGRVAQACGLELNNDAIDARVTSFEVRPKFVQEIAQSEPGAYDAVCSFQVFEHVPDPAEFMRSCLACVRIGGLLIISTPNHDFPELRERRDAFDLPPHHLNHFTAEVYENLARWSATRLLRVAQPPADFDPDMLARRQSMLGKIKASVRAATRTLALQPPRPGRDLLAVFRKIA